MHRLAAKKKSDSDEKLSAKDQALDLMVNYYALTGRIFVPGNSFLFDGTVAEIIEEMERVIMERWTRQASFEYQANQLARVLHRYEQFKTLTGLDQ